MAELQRLDPDVVLVFRPEIIPPRLFDALRATTIGYLTEPLPRKRWGAHRDLRARMGWLRQIDPGSFDRIISFDPLIANVASDVVPVWRAVPLPVADSLFMDLRERSHPPRFLFLGRSTPHREKLLEKIKQRHPVVHIGHGLLDGELTRFLARADVQFNIHNNPYPTFENRVSIALAAGHLVISEPLSPDHGLRPGGDYLEARDAETFAGLADELASDPTAYVDVQRSGREQAERFRASNVYPKLVHEAMEDIAEHSTGRGGR